MSTTPPETPVRSNVICFDVRQQSSDAVISEQIHNQGVGSQPAQVKSLDFSSQSSRDETSSPHPGFIGAGNDGNSEESVGKTLGIHADPNAPLKEYDWPGLELRFEQEIKEKRRTEREMMNEFNELAAVRSKRFFVTAVY